MKAVIFDLRDSNIGASSVFLKDGMSEIISYHREHVDPRDIGGFQLNESEQMTKQMRSLANKIHGSGVGAPEEVHCILGPHLHISQTRVVRAKFSEPIIVTQELIDDLVHEEIELFRIEYSHGTENINGPVEIIEHKNVQIKINGYECIDPKGKEASEIEIFVHVSVVPKKTLDYIKRNLFELFHTDNVEAHSSSVMAFNSVRDAVHHENNFVLLDINGNMTEVTIVKNGIIEESASIPMGVNSILKMISEKLSTFNGEAATILRLHNSGSLSVEMGKKINNLLTEVKNSWLRALTNALVKASENYFLPKTFLVIAPNDFKNIFLNFLREGDGEREFEIIKPRTIEMIENKMFNSVCKNKGGSGHDLFATMSSVFLNKIAKNIN